MSLFGKFRRWLNGCFVCEKCGREVYTMCFGYGEAICPDCYDGEQPFLFFDDSYWLNRITARLLKHRASRLKPYSPDPILIQGNQIPHEIEVTR